VKEAASLHKNDLPSPIQDASFLAFGLVTVGPTIEQEAERLRESGRLLDSMILDALSSAAVSELCEQVAYRVFDWAEERGLNASRAFEPGSGASRWPLENQRLIFANLRAEQIGVELTSHLLMRPIKSLSFLIGIGTEIKQASAPFSCQGCKRLDCPYRYEPSGSSPQRR
jgi:cobalamin-dependent methionine synthase I